MKQSDLFYKTFKKPPRDEQSTNSKFLIRGGFVDKLAAGVYTFLPLGLRVLKKIENIIREEMNAIDGQEILMPALNPGENWKKTGRWSSFEVLFKLKGRDKKDYALAPTHEEVITPLAKKFVFSYKDLPVYLYQIQNKFRNEPRAKSGLLRGREFLMKDLYSFHTSERDLDRYYEKVKKAYFNIFKRCGIGKETYLTLASGGSFSKYSHEFQTVDPEGEDNICVCQKCGLAINKGIKNENPKCPECGNNKFKDVRAIEVGNIFKLKTKYSHAFDLKFRNEKGREKEIIMGCYGVGLSRVMGAVVEVFNDKAGIIWPKNLAPFDAHILYLKSDKSSLDKKIKKACWQVYEKLGKSGLDILFDDRENVSSGEKFAESDLIGIPWRLVISERTLERGSVELKARNKENTQLVKIKDFEKIINLIK